MADVGGRHPVLGAAQCVRGLASVPADLGKGVDILAVRERDKHRARYLNSNTTAFNPIQPNTDTPNPHTAAGRGGAAADVPAGVRRAGVRGPGYQLPGLHPRLPQRLLPLARADRGGHHPRGAGAHPDSQAAHRCVCVRRGVGECWWWGAGGGGVLPSVMF